MELIQLALEVLANAILDDAAANEGAAGDDEWQDEMDTDTGADDGDEADVVVEEEAAPTATSAALGLLPLLRATQLPPLVGLPCTAAMATSLAANTPAAPPTATWPAGQVLQRCTALPEVMYTDEGGAPGAARSASLTTLLRLVEGVQTRALGCVRNLLPWLEGAADLGLEPSTQWQPVWRGLCDLVGRVRLQCSALQHEHLLASPTSLFLPLAHGDAVHRAGGGRRTDAAR